jgi:hypothetical protein
MTWWDEETPDEKQMRQDFADDEKLTNEAMRAAVDDAVAEERERIYWAFYDEVYRHSMNGNRDAGVLEYAMCKVAKKLNFPADWERWGPAHWQQARRDDHERKARR